MIAPNSDKPNGQPTTDTTPAESPKERKASRAKRNRQQAFLKAYVECGTISGAAQAAKISRTTHHRWLADENDVDYANAFALADEMFRSQLEDEARFRALQGLRRYKFNSKGEPVYVDCQKSHPEAVKYVDEKTGETRHRRHYYEENRSDVILIALLNEAFPDRFGRYRHDHAGKIEHGHAGKAVMKLKSRKALGKTAPCPKCGEPFVVEEKVAPFDDLDEFDDAFGDDAAYTDDFGDDDYDYDDQPQRPARSKPRKKKKRQQTAGWVKPTLIGVASLLVLLMLGGGVYLAMSLMKGGSRAEALAYLPKDSEVILVLRVADLMEEPSIRKTIEEQILQQPNSEKFYKDIGLDSLDDIEMIAFGMKDVSKMAEGSMPANPENFVLVIRAKKAIDSSKIRADSDISSHQGTEIYIAKTTRLSGSKMAGFLPDDRTFVAGPENLIREVIEQGPTGHHRDDLDFVDFDQPLLAAYVPKSGQLIPAQQKLQARSLITLGSAMAPGLKDAEGLVDRNFKGIAFGSTFGAGAKAKIQLACSNSAEAEATKADLKKLLGVGKDLFAQMGQGMDAERKTTVENAINSVEFSSNGTTVEVAITLPHKMRMISLVGLEKACEEYARTKKYVPPEIQYMAGLLRIDYVFVDHEKKDIIIAGPAEGFAPDATGRVVGVTTGRPPMRADDLVVALRTLRKSGQIGCSIDMVPERLAAMQRQQKRFPRTSNVNVVKSRFAMLARTLGNQDVRVWGVPADSHFGKTLVEADYVMKLVCIGRQPVRVRGFRSYLSMVGTKSNAMQRWWFTPMYDAFQSNDDETAFHFTGQRAQLLTEEEKVDEFGRRTPAEKTRKSTQRFAKLFTKKFPELAMQVPVFAELQNLMDLSILAALLDKKQLPEKIGWKMSLFLDPERAPVMKGHAPKHVPSTFNYTMTNRRVVTGLVNGGVIIDTGKALREIEFDRVARGKLLDARKNIDRRKAPPSKDHWWPCDCKPPLTRNRRRRANERIRRIRLVKRIPTAQTKRPRRQTLRHGHMYEDAGRLIETGNVNDDRADALLKSVGFEDCDTAATRLAEMCSDDRSRKSLSACLPMLLSALSEAATPDGSLVNFERYVQSVDDRGALFGYLANNPRAVEILIKLFVGSQFLTEILLRSPRFLQQLTNHKRLAEFKSRPQLIEEAKSAIASSKTLAEKLDALRRHQQWELLRIGACDSFGLFDLKSVTVQLSLLADSIVQIALELLSEELGISAEGFAVIAFGKLGGEELNYSSDIDLVFVADGNATRFWRLGQRLIKSLMEPTGEGFFYRVDMRLRPWGRSGALVNTVDAHIDYLKKHGMAWEKQALLKARTIAGDRSVGQQFLERVTPLIFSMPADAVRESIREMKGKIEEGLKKQGREWGEVKAGQGSIRDVEFVTQCLQLIHGADHPEVRSINTMDGIVRLADFGFLQADEYRHLTGGYKFLRTIEHALQLMHYKQAHSLPESRRELKYLARRLDFPGADRFLWHYDRHCTAIRAIYEKYIEQQEDADVDGHPLSAVDRFSDHRGQMEPSYAETFSDDEIALHAQLLERLSDRNLVEFEAVPAENGLWRMTIVGFNHPGELSLICGMLFVYGYNILTGHVFTAEAAAAARAGSSRSRSRKRARGRSRKFVNVFTLQPPVDVVPPDVWNRYKSDLLELVEIAHAGKLRAAQGRLAKRVAGALRETPGDDSVLLPVDIELDNTTSKTSTILHIRAEDTIGFLYELSNGLAMTGIEIERVTIDSIGNQVYDTLFVTDVDGEKLSDESRLRELRTAVVLIKHFTHLLPRSPDPESALLQFRDFLQNLFKQPDWSAELASLERPDVLRGLAKLLGVSSFLWEDFLRLQHENLFPVIADVDGLSIEKSKQSLAEELAAALADAKDDDERRKKLNAFKDREMFRIDMRHILGNIDQFGQFAEELSDLAEVVVASAYEICYATLEERFGRPQVGEDRECAISVCALGKCGGREMGFASDVELMFLYEDAGRTTGPENITTTEFVLKLVELFKRTIKTRRKGIFEIDLRLRPYGKAGSLAVSFEAFGKYFAPNGAAWPYERQALVKLRPVAGDREFGRQIVAKRDEMVYSGDAFDVTAMRAMREKQIHQLVKAGTFNAKLSLGGLVDCEYLVQGLQMMYGKDYPPLRTRSTRKAIAALFDKGVFTAEQRDGLLEAYVFLRRLIDALRMVRGHARDLTVPDPDSEEFQFLARRLEYGNDTRRLADEIERRTACIQEFEGLLESST
eukprot:g8320.t1